MRITLLDIGGQCALLVSFIYGFLLFDGLNWFFLCFLTSCSHISVHV